ncbi:NAD-dependent epimerase/dehydratase family protein [Sphingobacterium corticis]|uniref:NAD-dependent epimerase/dehydratase family protein n=1 Tax=Sphingobacterium corticis TaxID=1812823 RepID=A0ABW5NI15_9SPHI
MMPLKLLITGASGFVGYHLVRTAKNAGFEVHAAIRKSSNVKDIEQFVDHFIFPDFTNVPALSAALQAESYDYIIHAAALTKAKRESDMIAVNVDYTLNLLSAAFSLETPPKHIHIVSSLAAVGPRAYDPSFYITEETPYQPVTVYGRSKMKMELLVKERFSDKPISIFRPTAVYGPREKDLFILFQTLNKGVDAYIGRGAQSLSFIYVKDLADLLVRSITMNTPNLETYNVTDGNVYNRYQMADIFKSVTQKRMFRMHVPFGIVKRVAEWSEWLYRSSKKTPVIYPERLHELTAGNWACDISKIKHNLEFTPQHDLEAGLTETLAWYKEHRWL